MEASGIKFPASVMAQKIFKAKVVFLGVDKKSKEYNKYKTIGANGNKYLVEDGKIAYLPEEAYNSLMDASGIIRKMNTKQEKYGIDLDDPNDQYVKERDPRFDVTIIGEYAIGKKDNQVYLIPKQMPLDDEAKSALDEAKAEMRKDLERQMREDLEEEFREREEALKRREQILLNEIEKIPDATPDNEIDDLISGE